MPPLSLPPRWPTPLPCGWLATRGRRTSWLPQAPVPFFVCLSFSHRCSALACLSGKLAQLRQVGQACLFTLPFLTQCLFMPVRGLPIGYWLDPQFSPSTDEMARLLTFLSPNEPHHLPGRGEGRLPGTSRQGVTDRHRQACLSGTSIRGCFGSACLAGRLSQLLLHASPCMSVWHASRPSMSVPSISDLHDELLVFRRTATLAPTARLRRPCCSI